MFPMHRAAGAPPAPKRPTPPCVQLAASHALSPLPPPLVAASDSDSQVPIFLERLRQLFQPASADDRQGGEPRRRGVAVAVCLGLSLVLWFSLTLQESRTVSMELPVQVTVPEGEALAALPPSTVEAQVEGSGLDLLRLLFDPALVSIEAAGGTVDVRDRLTFGQGANLRVESVVPRRIEVKTEPRIERQVPVQSRVELAFAPAHELLGPPELEPDSIRVSGAQSVVEGISAWATEGRRIEGVDDTARTQVALIDTLSSLVQRETDRVTLVARAGRFSEATREVTVEVTGVPPEQNLVALQPSTIRIRYRVLFDQLFESQRSSGFFATVSYSQIRADTTGVVTPTVHVPSDLMIRDPEPVPSRLRYYTFLSSE